MSSVLLAQGLEQIGLSPWGVVLGFFGSTVGLFVVNNTGLSVRKALLAVLSAMLLCAFVHDYVSTLTEQPALASLLTLGASIIAPDAFTLLRENGRTLTGRIGTWLFALIKKTAGAIAGMPAQKEPPGTDHPDNPTP